MKVSFLTLGTRGDVQPYVALAKELISNKLYSCILNGFMGIIYNNISISI